MPKSFPCPHCGGQFEAEHVGLLKDKWLVCQHCGDRVDVPDEYAVALNVEVPKGGYVLTEEELQKKVANGEAILDAGDDGARGPRVDSAVLQAPAPEDVASTRRELERKIKSGEELLGKGDTLAPTAPADSGQAAEAGPGSSEARGPVPDEPAKLPAKRELEPGATHVVTKPSREKRPGFPRAGRSGSGSHRLVTGRRSEAQTRHATKPLVRWIAILAGLAAIVAALSTLAR